jgi:hypothetical protein
MPRLVHVLTPNDWQTLLPCLASLVGPGVQPRHHPSSSAFDADTRQPGTIGSLESVRCRDSGNDLHTVLIDTHVRRR